MTTHRLAFILTLAALTACSGLPKYTDSRDSDAAIITNWSHLTLCGIKGLAGPGVWPNRMTACAARIINIDGAQVAGLGSVSIAPGDHKIRLMCQTSNAKGFIRTYAVEISPRGRYQLQPRWEQEFCVVDMIDSTTNQPAPMALFVEAGG